MTFTGTNERTYVWSEEALTRLFGFGVRKVCVKFGANSTSRVVEESS